MIGSWEYRQQEQAGCCRVAVALLTIMTHYTTRSAASYFNQEVNEICSTPFTSFVDWENGIGKPDAKISPLTKSRPKLQSHR